MIAILAGVFSFILFALFQTLYISAGDTGDLVTAAVTMGVAHPPGYPLYTFLGWILNHLPLYTSVWKVTLLSSLPHAITIAILYAIVFRITKNTLASLLSCIVLAGNYVFFLYSVTPEVFALLDMSIILLFWLFWSWKIKNTSGFVYVSGLFMGLALAHHHMILFATVAFVYFLYPDRRRFLRVISVPWFVFCIVLGFSVYLYVPIAARGLSMINWDNATSVANFIQLITRADYGTFQSGAAMGQLPLQRLLQLKAYAQYLIMDFTWIGLVFAGLGFLLLKNTARQVFRFIITGVIFLGPLFFFYASFPLTSRFSLGTYERFLLPSYLLLSILVGVGVHGVQHYILKIRASSPHVSRIASTGFALVLCIVFGVKLTATLSQFQGLRSDRTAHNLGMDVLSPLPADSILLLNRDTTLFTTQFVRYGLNTRPDVFVLHTNRMGTGQYTSQLKRIFPQLIYPSKEGQTFVTQFLMENVKSRRIFSNAKFNAGAGWFWVPFGLVYELTAESNLPAITKLYEYNSSIWNTLHTPQTGILLRFNHLMLSDVRDVYTDQRVEFGKTLLKSGEFGKAREQFIQSISYGGDSTMSEAYIYKGLSEFYLGNCRSALDDFQSAETIAITPDKEILLYKATTYRDCLKDATVAASLFEEYTAHRDRNEATLQQL